MLRTLVNAVRVHQYPKPRTHLSRNHRKISESDSERLRGSLEHNFYRGQRSRDRFSASGFANDMSDHMHARTESNRRLVVPWLDGVCGRLDGLRILEVGCGTGASAVAMAEQGAHVTGIDVDADALKVAEDRCQLYGLRARVQHLNAVDAGKRFSAGDFDIIILFASLEHMTMPERLTGLPGLWALLKPGARLAVVETPNRLWFHDHHTSLLPFFNWLPDDLAFAYSRFSGREQFKDDYRIPTEEKMHEFLRQGRGVSFHEFDVAIGTHEVETSFSSYFGLRHTGLRSPRAARFKQTLRSVRPDLHDGWFEPSLDIMLRKG
jgi:2-polyprenyl-3-methyl-5-hydroxy-6-metoxy-1,4-benzoquinol methylase